MSITCDPDLKTASTGYAFVLSDGSKIKANTGISWDSDKMKSGH